MAGHWSKDMYTLWWRDKGTGRMRVSFHRDRDKLLARVRKVWHEDMDAALYSPDGSRLPLSAPAEKPKRQRKARPKATPPVEPPVAA